MLLLFACALASDQSQSRNQVILPSGKVVHDFSSKRFFNTTAKEIRGAVAKKLNQPDSCIKLVGEKDKTLEDEDVVDEIKTITAVILQNTVEVIEQRPRHTQDALALVRNGATGVVNVAMAYPQLVASMADELSNKDYGHGATCCLLGTCAPIGIFVFILLLFHATFFGKFEWELNRDARNNVCGRFKVNTDFLDEDNEWDSYVIQFCKDGWETTYTRTSVYIGFCNGKEGFSICPKFEQVPDVRKIGAKAFTLRRREYDSSMIDDEQIVETDALLKERNKQFKREDNRNPKKLAEIEDAKYRLEKMKGAKLAQRKENAPKHLEQKSKRKR